MAGYEAAVEQLSSAGLVDPNRVGIIGFSVTCYYALEALTTSNLHFRAASITLPAAIGAVAKTPRPFSGSWRISRRSFGMGRRLSRARALRTAAAAIRGDFQLGRGSGAVARPVAGADRGGRGCRGARRRHLSRRAPSGLLFGFLHAG